MRIVLLRNDAHQDVGLLYVGKDMSEGKSAFKFVPLLNLPPVVRFPSSWRTTGKCAVREMSDGLLLSMELPYGTPLFCRLRHRGGGRWELGTPSDEGFMPAAGGYCVLISG